MTLTTQQVKIAKTICKENGINEKLVNKELGKGFWEDTCNSSFEGYLTHLTRIDCNELALSMLKTLNQSTARYRAGKSGAISL